MKVIGGLKLLALSMMCAWFNTAVYAVTIDDPCDIGGNANDINTLTATYNVADDEIVVEMTLCSVLSNSVYNKTKYRVHFDHTAPFAVDADRNGDTVVDAADFCVTTSDDGMMHRAKKDNGPGLIEVDGTTLTFTVAVDALNDQLVIGDTVYIWADTQWKGINDRAPNTEAGNGCAKPEVESETLALTLQADKTVFVTSATYNGNLGGLAGADAICQARAEAEGSLAPPGTYRAWLSTGGLSATGRLNHSTMPYVLTDGTVIAEDWANLTDGNLDSPININEFGVGAGTPYRVWTNTNADGSANRSSSFQLCGNWTSNSSGFAFVGRLDWATSWWTFESASGCGIERHLYCFEQ